MHKILSVLAKLSLCKKLLGDTIKKQFNLSTINYNWDDYINILQTLPNKVCTVTIILNRIGSVNLKIDGTYIVDIKRIDTNTTIVYLGSPVIDYNFCHDHNYIKEVIIGEGVKIISPLAFYKCAGLRTVSLPESLEVIGESAFHGTTWLALQPIIPDTIIMIDNFYGDEE